MDTALPTDLWDFFDIAYADEIPCVSARRLLFFLRSPRTSCVEAKISIPQSYAILTVYGPHAIPTTDENGKKWERVALSYKLTREEVWSEPPVGLDADERHELLQLINAKRFSFDMRVFCDALKLPRVARVK